MAHEYLLMTPDLDDSTPGSGNDRKWVKMYFEYWGKMKGRSGLSKAAIGCGVSHHGAGVLRARENRAAVTFYSKEL